MARYRFDAFPRYQTKHVDCPREDSQERANLEKRPLAAFEQEAASVGVGLNSIGRLDSMFAGVSSETAADLSPI